MGDNSRPYMAKSYFGAMRTPRTSKAGPHSEGKKPYHAGDYLEMELYDITDIPPYVDSPLTGYPPTPPPGEPPTPEGDPCAKADRVYLVQASPTSLSGCSGTVSGAFTLYISPDFKCPALFQLATLSSGPEVRFNDQPMIVNGISQRFPLYTIETTEDGETIKSAGGTITIDFLDCGNHSPWMTLAVAEECPCPGDPLIYGTAYILLDQCASNCTTCDNPDCDDCPLVIGGGPTGGRASLSTSYNYTLTGAVGSVVWSVDNDGCTISGSSSTGCTLNVGADACNYNNGAIILTATDTRGENVCTKTKSAQVGTWVITAVDNYCGYPNQQYCAAPQPCSTGCCSSFDCYVYATCNKSIDDLNYIRTVGGCFSQPCTGSCPSIDCDTPPCGGGYPYSAAAYRVHYQWKCP